MSRYVKAALLASVVIVSACMSSGPATTFYSLFATKDVPPLGVTLDAVSLGVGPIVLPEYLDNPSVVSLTSSQKVKVLGYHAWAGSLKESMVRVASDDISRALALDAVWGFPWDARLQPDYQVRVTVTQFDGVRGGDVILRAKWALINKAGESLVALRAVELTEVTTSESVDDYVAALNRALNQFSLLLANDIVTAITHQQAATPYKF